MGRLRILRPFHTLKSFLPKHLFGRALLILLVPPLLATSITIYVFIDRHLDNITRRLADDIAGEIGATVSLVQQHKLEPDELRQFARRNFGFDATVLKSIPSRRKHRTPLRNLGTAFLEEALSYHLPQPHEIIMTNDTIFVSTSLGENVLQIAMSRKRLLSKSTPVFMMWLLGTPVFLFLVAAVFMHKQVRPIRRLADAMDRFGKGQHVTSFIPSGAFEVRKAAIAFNTMRARIARQISRRTEMLAGVSHDLRTPLTRMSLQLAISEDLPEAKALQADIKEMTKMIDSYLAFAKGDDQEASRSVIVRQFLDEIVVPAKANIEIDCNPDTEISLKRQSMKRCIVNLLENAQHHASHIWIRVISSNQWLTILVEDNGPGIPPEKRQRVFKPFYRLDVARNLNTAGVGLGLAIAKDSAHQHGGDITLHDSPHGGLQVKIQIPA
ncbi:MAG: ATP-binding protein [Pseudomonadota bacterium]